MDTPTNLYASGIDAYERAVDTLQRLGDDPALWVDGIARYARAVDDVQRLREGWEMDGRPQHAMGSTSNLVVHPLVKGIREAEQHAAAMAKAIGLTPDGRAAVSRKAGRQMGDSTAPDRPRLRKAA
jgi:P27 family predicted phage terminase small subunit